MVRLTLHGSNAEVQFGSAEGGMSITGNAQQVQFEAADAPLLTIQRDSGDGSTGGGGSTGGSGAVAPRSVLNQWYVGPVKAIEDEDGWSNVWANLFTEGGVVALNFDFYGADLLSAMRGKIQSFEFRPYGAPPLDATWHDPHHMSFNLYGGAPSDAEVAFSFADDYATVTVTPPTALGSPSEYTSWRGADDWIIWKDENAFVLPAPLTDPTLPPPPPMSRPPGPLDGLPMSQRAHVNQFEREYYLNGIDSSAIPLDVAAAYGAFKNKFVYWYLFTTPQAVTRVAAVTRQMWHGDSAAKTLRCELVDANGYTIDARELTAELAADGSTPARLTDASADAYGRAGAGAPWVFEFDTNRAAVKQVKIVFVEVHALDREALDADVEATAAAKAYAGNGTLNMGLKTLAMECHDADTGASAPYPLALVHSDEAAHNGGFMSNELRNHGGDFSAPKVAIHGATKGYDTVAIDSACFAGVHVVAGETENGGTTPAIEASKLGALPAAVRATVNTRTVLKPSHFSTADPQLYAALVHKPQATVFFPESRYVKNFKIQIRTMAFDDSTAAEMKLTGWQLDANGATQPAVEKTVALARPMDGPAHLGINAGKPATPRGALDLALATVQDVTIDATIIGLTIEYTAIRRYAPPKSLAEGGTMEEWWGGTPPEGGDAVGIEYYKDLVKWNMWNLGGRYAITDADDAVYTDVADTDGNYVAPLGWTVKETGAYPRPASKAFTARARDFLMGFYGYLHPDEKVYHLFGGMPYAAGMRQGVLGTSLGSQYGGEKASTLEDHCFEVHPSAVIDVDVLDPNAAKQALAKIDAFHTGRVAALGGGGGPVDDDDDGM